MIFQSFRLVNLVSLCMKILNSVVVVGLYYGFLTTLSMGPSYLFVLRARFIEDGIEDKVSATTGFLMGQLMMFISIYYAPLHLALCKPHTLTVLAIPYLFFHFFWNTDDDFFSLEVYEDFGSNNRNSMRDLITQLIFLNNLIFILFNHFIFPSSVLVRLVNIYMFRCNNKMLFATSSLVGCLIGHILFMKWFKLILDWIYKNTPKHKALRAHVLFDPTKYRKNKYLNKCVKWLGTKYREWGIDSFLKTVRATIIWMRINYSIRPTVDFVSFTYTEKFYVSEMRTLMVRVLSILLFIICLYSIGRAPVPLLTKKLKERLIMEPSEEERDVETTSETKGTRQEQEGSTEEEEDPDKIDETEEIKVNGKEKTKDEFPILIEKKKKNRLWVEKAFVTILFDSKRWNRPFRYIKTNTLDTPLRRDMGQYFFYTCLSDGKERISFTYPPSLSTFLELIERKISLFITQKISSDELYNHWNSKNEQKKIYISNEFINRVQTLDKGYLASKTLEKRTRLCNDKTKKEYLPQTYDPLLSGPFRGKRRFFFSSSLLNKTLRTNFREFGERFWINKIHLILLITHFGEFERKTDLFNSKDESFSKEIAYFLNLINKFGGKSRSSFNFMELSFFQLLFDRVIANPKKKTSRKNSTGLKEISKQAPRWSYNRLITEVQYLRGLGGENTLVDDHQLRSRYMKLIPIFTAALIDVRNNQMYLDAYDPKKGKVRDRDNPEEIFVSDIHGIVYSAEDHTDFRRELIKGSMRAQRRKLPIVELATAIARAPLFLERRKRSFVVVPFCILARIQTRFMKTMFLNWMCKNTELKILNSIYRKKETKPKKPKTKETIAILIKKAEMEDERRREEEELLESQKESESTEEQEEADDAYLESSDAWEGVHFPEATRSAVLLSQSCFRKYIVLPSLIITKNIIRIVFGQTPEWSEDFKDWDKERHINCNYTGVGISETELPKDWFTEGMQIKILFPFRLKPWRRSKLKLLSKGNKKKKVEENEFYYLTALGLGSDIPFGRPVTDLSPLKIFFKPILKKLSKKMKKMTTKMKKMTTKGFRILTVLEERRNFFANLDKNYWLIHSFLNESKKINESKKTKDSISTINKNNRTVSNQTVSKLSNPIGSMPCTNDSLIERRRIEIQNQIEKITKERENKKKTSEVNISPNKRKRSSNAKKCISSNKILYILKRKSERLACKLDFFLENWIQIQCIGVFFQCIDVFLFLGIINIPRLRLNTQLFLESIKKINTKYISNNESNHKKMDKPNQKKFKFISKLRNSDSEDNLIVTKNSSSCFYDISLFSQAYVFYKLSQSKTSNLYKLRSIFEYQNLFLKSEIKNYFRAEGLLNSELKDKNLINSFSLMNQWKNWLRSDHQYKYDLSPFEWSRLIPEKCKSKNRIYQDLRVQKEKLSQWDLQDHFVPANGFRLNLFTNNNKKNKPARYSLLSYKSVNYEKKTDFFSSESPTNKATIPCRKFLDWRLIHFCLQKRVDIESWIDTCSKDKKKTMDNKNFSFLPIYQDQEINSSKTTRLFFNWMGMNEEIQTSLISNSIFQLPIQFLLLNFHKNRNHNKKESDDQVDFGAVFTNEEKKIDEDSMGLDMTKHRNKKQNKSDPEREIDFLLNKYLGFGRKNKTGFALAFDRNYFDHVNIDVGSFNTGEVLWDDMKRYGFLLRKRTRDTKKTLLSYIRKDDLDLALFLGLTEDYVKELFKGRILVLTPTYLLIKMDGRFLLYQMVSILLVHKNKEQINKKYRDKFYVDKKKKNFTDVGNREKTDYDLFVPENLLSPKRRRELRILSSFNFKNKNDIHRNTEIFDGNNIKNGSPVLEKNKYLWREKKNLIKLKFFLWPNFRLEDLACMNRYWFDTNNGSRFSMLRIYIYPRLKF